MLRRGNFSRFIFKKPITKWHRSGIFIVNFEHVSHLVLVFLFLTLNMQLPAGVTCTLKELLKTLEHEPELDWFEQSKMIVNVKNLPSYDFE